MEQRKVHLRTRHIGQRDWWIFRKKEEDAMPKWRAKPLAEPLQRSRALFSLMVLFAYMEQVPAETVCHDSRLLNRIERWMRQCGEDSLHWKKLSRPAERILDEARERVADLLVISHDRVSTESLVERWQTGICLSANLVWDVRATCPIYYNTNFRYLNKALSELHEAMERQFPEIVDRAAEIYMEVAV